MSRAVEMDPDHCFGKARLAGTRIHVGLIVEMLAAYTPEEIVEQYPHLKLEQVRAAILEAGDYITRTWRVPCPLLEEGPP